MPGARFAGKTQTDELAFSLMGHERAFPAAGESGSARPRHRRLVLRFGGRGRRRARRHRRRLRHRRLDPRAGKLLRADRPAHHAWPHLARRRDAARAFPRHVRLVRQRHRDLRSGRRGAARPTICTTHELQRPLALDRARRARARPGRKPTSIAPWSALSHRSLGAPRTVAAAVAFHRRSLLVLPQAAGLRGLAESWRLDRGEGSRSRPRRQGALRLRRNRRRGNRTIRNGTSRFAFAPNLPTCSARTAFSCCRPCRVRRR